MPGVMLDLGVEDLSFASDSAASIYNSSSPLCSPLPLSQHSHSPHSALQQAGARRSSSFNGRGHDTFAQLAPLSYTRSQSLINTSAIPQAFGNYYSLPSTPNKLSEMAMLEGLEDLDCGPGSPGMGDGGFGSLDAAMMSGASYLSDLRPGMSSVGEGLHSPSGSSRGMPTSPTSLEGQQILTALQKFWLNNNSEEDESWPPAVDVYACDEFRMFEFKVRRCMRGRSHDWTECPFAHPGEKARRRDPRRFHYSGTACPDFRKGSCRRGDACEFAHGVFECWLHPARYRTQPCKDGRSCRRRVCFFAHTQEQLRLLPGAAQAASVARNVLSSSQASALAACLSQTGASLSGFESSSPRYDGSSRTTVAGTFDGGVSFDGSRSLAQCGYDGVGLNASSLCGQYGSFNDGSVGHCCASQVSSPTSTLVGHTLSPPPLSPPLSPSASPVSPSSPHSWPSAFMQHSSPSLAQHASSNLMQHTSSKGMSDLIATLQQLDLRGGGAVSPFFLQAQAQQVAAQSAQYSSGPSPLRRCSQSVPCTPTKLRWEGKDQQKHPWEVQEVDDDEQNVQRVVSGRDLRSKMYGKLGKENRLDGGEAPDLDWVNELVQEDSDQNW